jgi:3-isopropylmalate/(R)-2-methylmalate dehydratase small subunit
MAHSKKHKTMAYDKFQILTSTAYPLPTENVDTDQIIPARFLKATERVDFDVNFFRDWRYHQDGTPKADFPLNKEVYAGSQILVGGRNFGSGSSREHAAWSVYDFGLRCVISSAFADIFKNNCLNVGVLPVQVSAEFADLLFTAIMADPKTVITVDLPNQKVTLVATGQSESFAINTYKKDNMLNGFDDIDYLKNIENEITEFAKTRPF